MSSPTVLSSWKEVAAFFGKSVRTVQRWERSLNLPIIRPEQTEGNIILARVSDLESWMKRPICDAPVIATLEKRQHNRSECRHRAERMEMLLAELNRHAARLQRNTSVMNESFLRMKAISDRATFPHRSLNAVPIVMTALAPKHWDA